MASLTSVGDEVRTRSLKFDTPVLINISGTYDMTIRLQKEVRSPGSGVWETIKTYTAANDTVNEIHWAPRNNTVFRLLVVEDNSGTATASLDIQPFPVTAAYRFRAIRFESGNYTIRPEDGGEVLFMKSDNANTLTIPLDPNNSHEIGAQVDGVSTGSGTTTIQAESGVTLNGVDGGSTTVNTQYGGFMLVKEEFNRWVVLGSVGPVS